jgi:hypothetical protein
MFVNKPQQPQSGSDLQRQVAIPGEAQQGTKKRKVAVFVAHGMGQQVPFETMDCVAAGLMRMASKGNQPAASIRAETCLIGGQKLQRIELAMTDEGDEPLEVHVYEGYWAPVTEGQVKITDVMSFLLRGGVNGIRNAGRDFHRWLFGGAVNFGKRPKTGFFLSIASLAVLSLIVANFLVTVLFADRLAAKLKDPGAVGGAILAPDDQTFTALTTLVAGWVIYSVAIAIVLGLAHRTRSSAWTWPLGVLLWGWVAYTILGLGFAPPLVLAGCIDVSAFGFEVFNTYSVVVWILLLVLSYLLRGVMIQFPGDVAAYISTHTLDRFQKIRTEIKDSVSKVAKAIYAGNDYEGVVWVGHSLGSVVVYDALNGVIMDDQLAGHTSAVDRTRLLVTFGSPLDKIAFIFASQWVRATETREALAASFQPLVLDYQKFRKFPWANVWSRADIISGDLDFYDDLKKSNGQQVVNIIDERATTPLLAHIEYWQNPLLFELVYAGVTRRDVPAAVAQIAKMRAHAPADDVDQTDLARGDQ